MEHSVTVGKGDDRALDLYLKEISETPLLERVEEVKLAERIKQGDGAALERLVKANLRFVVSVAKQYQNQGMNISDLISEGNLGLIKAAKRFDESRGFKFISYAVYWIRQAILAALSENSRIVRLPLSRVGSLHKIGRAKAQLAQTLGCEPTDEDIAHFLDGITIKEIAEAKTLGVRHLSMDAPFDKSDEGSLHDVIEDELTADPEQNLELVALRQMLDKVIGQLEDREAEVLRLYFGWNNQAPLTLNQIGLRFNITRERVRQIKEKAIRLLRRKLRFLEGQESRDLQALAGEDRQKEISSIRLVRPVVPIVVKPGQSKGENQAVASGEDGLVESSDKDLAEAAQTGGSPESASLVVQIKQMVDGLRPVVGLLPEDNRLAFVGYYGLDQAYPANNSGDDDTYFKLIEQREKAFGMLMKITGRSYSELRHIFYQYRMYRLAGKI